LLADLILTDEKKGEKFTKIDHSIIWSTFAYFQKQSNIKEAPITGDQ